jgi:pimeloyl-ACP methyl ester carboxylesterase
MARFNLLRVAFLLAAIGALVVQSVAYRNRMVTARYLEQFKHEQELGSYQEAEQRVFWGRHKAPRAVLLLHGWSSSPADFAELYPLLEQADIPYLAPQITGFGRDSMSLLPVVRPQDWLRDAIHAYDILAAQAEEVDVIGHSNGGALATYVAEHRQVGHLILVGPNLTVQPSDRIYKELLGTPGVRTAMAALLPVFRKPVRPGRVVPVDTVDPDSARHAFAYPALPLNALRVLWQVQDMVAIGRAHFGDLNLFYGMQDQSVDIPALLADLKRESIRYQAHGYPHSGHNLLEDYDKADAAREIMAVLQG